MSNFQPLSVSVHNGKYHDCFTVYKDGTQLLINYELDERCILPTSDPFWKRVEDVNFKIQTIGQEAKKKLLHDSIS